MVKITRSGAEEGGNPLLVGVRRATRSPMSYRYRSRRNRPGDEVDLPADSTYWEVTTDYKDLSLHDNEFIPAATVEGCLEALCARFPSPDGCPALRRVESFGPTTRNGGGGYENGVYRQSTPVAVPARYLVHAQPCLVGKASDGDLESWAAMHGPILLRRERADNFSTHGTDCVLSDAGTPDYRLLKHDPTKARAREKGDETKSRNIREATERDRAKYAHDRELHVAGTEIVNALSTLADAMHDDLARFEICDALHAGAHECASLAIVHAKFRGRRAYRRLPAWAEMVALYRARPVELDLSRHLNDATLAFVVAEAAARKPRARVDKSAPVDLPAVDDGEHADADAA